VFGLSMAWEWPPNGESGVPVRRNSALGDRGGIDCPLARGDLVGETGVSPRACELRPDWRALLRTADPVSVLSVRN
jgi:hypothetical protein